MSMICLYNMSRLRSAGKQGVDPLRGGEGAEQCPRNRLAGVRFTSCVCRLPSLSENGHEESESVDRAADTEILQI